MIDNNWAGHRNQDILCIPVLITSVINLIVLIWVPHKNRASHKDLGIGSLFG